MTHPERKNLMKDWLGSVQRERCAWLYFCGFCFKTLIFNKNEHTERILIGDYWNKFVEKKLWKKLQWRFKKKIWGKTRKIMKVLTFIGCLPLFSNEKSHFTWILEKIIFILKNFKRSFLVKRSFWVRKVKKKIKYFT